MIKPGRQDQFIYSAAFLLVTGFLTYCVFMGLHCSTVVQTQP